jgi:inosine/xanthosine triphosphate pyrophosphatase family protein
MLHRQILALGLMSRLVFVTGNANKVREVKQILGSAVEHLENRKIDRRFPYSLWS